MPAASRAEARVRGDGEAIWRVCGRCIRLVACVCGSHSPLARDQTKPCVQFCSRSSRPPPTDRCRYRSACFQARELSIARSHNVAIVTACMPTGSARTRETISSRHGSTKSKPNGKAFRVSRDLEKAAEVDSRDFCARSMRSHSFALTTGASPCRRRRGRCAAARRSCRPP